MMEEIGISSSQYSIFDSQTLSDSDIDLGELKDRPDQYKKKPLNEDMTQRSRRRRVAKKRETLKKWSEEEGTTITELLGYLIYLDNYHSGEKSLASLGYRIFKGENVFEKPEKSVNEAIWMIELGRISQAVWLEYRLRFQDRIVLPTVNKVRCENQKHRPELTEYEYGMLASLETCLSLTITERLQYIDLSGVNEEESYVTFKFTWGSMVVVTTLTIIN